ncbi:MAG: hypothetical protein HDT39_06940 [Lachnospiraceae bacterium]|nr:hypothetical protein [Lachnospiraceae bacterium]
MDEKIFKELKEKYDNMQTVCQLQIDLHKKKSVRKCFNRGYMLDILPFENELRGYKLRKKELKRMVMENNCCIYHFDAKDRVCLIEEANTFLSSIDDYTFYDYYDNCLYRYICQSDGIINISKYFLENGKITEGYVYARFGHSYEQYVYDGERLEKIVFKHFNHQQESESSWESRFCYDKKDKLKLIQQVYDNGYMTNCYADVKLNYKKLEISLYEICKEKIELFFKEHEAEEIEAMALRLWIDDLEPMLDINFRVLGDDEYSVAEWLYSSFADINIADVPLDSVQQDKIVSIVYAVLIKLVDEGVINKDIKLKVFHGGEMEIGLDKKSVQKMIKGRENFL